MFDPFTPASTINLTSTTSNQTTAIPAGVANMMIHNAGANAVYFAVAGTVAVPATLTTGVGCIGSGQTRVFTLPYSTAAQTLAYIAKTAGGELNVSFGGGI